VLEDYEDSSFADICELYANVVKYYDDRLEMNPESEYVISNSESAGLSEYIFLTSKNLERRHF
jgi:hypothetical protein